MESLFKWMSEMSTSEGLKYFLIIASILALLPYTEIISKFLKQLVLRKKLEIQFFEYSVTQNIFAGKDDEGNDIYLDLPNDDIFISNTKLKLYWKVKGAYRVDLDPLGVKLKGNAAEVLINPDVTRYTLTAYGFWGKKLTAEINIPLDKIYYLDATPFSEYTNNIIRTTHKAILVQQYSHGKLFKMNDWLKSHLIKPVNSKIVTDKLIHANINRKKLYNNLDNSRLLRTYNFSTKKYQKIDLSNL
jgi:hypothetical protein